MSLVQKAAVGTALLLAGVAVFQVALALGASWGDVAYGGRAVTDNGVLPGGYRVMSAAAALVLLLSVWMVLARAGVAPSRPLGDEFLKWATWAVFGFLVLNTLSNLSSRSVVERWGMGSITLVAATLCLIVALNAPHQPVADTGPRPVSET